MRKREYHPPRIFHRGDLKEDTLGASGTQSDGGGYQAGGNGTTRSVNSRSNQRGGTFDRSAFDKSVFDK